MCRFVAYLGHEVLLADVLVKPSNSIVMQSLHARETNIPTNGDGFGLGWYSPLISKNPGIFKSIYPAWNDNNLLHLTSRIMSPCFFAHVRAASSGGVTHYNCHPFARHNWMLMHNGQIQDFILIRRHLRRLLDDDLYNWLEGDTDSEHIFALFWQIAKKHNMKNIDDAVLVLIETLEVIGDLVARYSTSKSESYFNLCITNGSELLATRYCTNPGIIPETLHISCGSQFIAKGGKYHMRPINGSKVSSILVSSEKLTDFEAEWQDIPPNNFLTIDAKLQTKIFPVVIKW